MMFIKFPGKEGCMGAESGKSQIRAPFISTFAKINYFKELFVILTRHYLIPVFIDFLSKDRNSDAWEITSTIVNLLLITLVLLTILGVLSADSQLSLTAPGLSIETHLIAVKTFRILWSGVICCLALFISSERISVYLKKLKSTTD